MRRGRTTGVSRLAGALDRRTERKTRRPDALELGTIQADLSLRLDRFARTLPRGEYLIVQHLTLDASPPVIPLVPDVASLPDPDTHAHTGSTGLAGDGPHLHSISHGEGHTHYRNAIGRYRLVAGDRVLVAWTNDHQDPVVIDVVEET